MWMMMRVGRNLPPWRLKRRRPRDRWRWCGGRSSLLFGTTRIIIILATEVREANRRGEDGAAILGVSVLFGSGHYSIKI